MKKILAVTLALTAGSALAQNYTHGSRYSQNQEADGATSVAMARSGMRHMFQFTPETIESAVLSFDRIKSRGADADSGTNLKLSLNYAYGITRLLQIGARMDYHSGLAGTQQGEGLTGQVGAILNNMDDLTSAAYVSLWLGAGYNQTYAGSTKGRDDLRLATVAVGKRFPLDQWGIKHVVYSPEIALKTLTSTTSKTLDYQQSLEFRILQFSVFF